MKSAILSLILIAWVQMAFAQGAISNILVVQGTGETERVVDILFDLSGNDLVYDLALEVSFDDGDTYAPIDPGEVTGALTVSPGAGIHLVWDGRVSYAGIATDMARIRITATTWQCGNTITDIDGNIYNTVLIGTQCWMQENLKTTQYRNETPIENPTGNSDWQNNTTGAYAWYDNDINWKDSYGALYNWHAVNNANGLCPTGWHVPSDAEWTQLVDYVVAQGFPNQWDNPNGAGNALKSCRQVNSPLVGGCNTTEHPRWDSDATHNGFDEFGFSALPGGYRGTNGSFLHIGINGYWWSSTELSSTFAWYRGMYYNYGNVSRDYNLKTHGFSARCLRDN